MKKSAVVMVLAGVALLLAFVFFRSGGVPGPRGVQSRESVSPVPSGDPELPAAVSPVEGPSQDALDRSLAAARARLAALTSLKDLIPAMVELEELASRAGAAQRDAWAARAADRLEDRRFRALLALVVGFHPGAKSPEILLRSLEREEGPAALALVFALSARAESFSRERAERFWLEAVHHAEFASHLDAALFEKAAKAPDAPKSFKIWYERVGPAERGPVVLGGLGAVRRTRDALLRNDLLFYLRPPSQGGKPLVEAVRDTLAGIPEIELKARCLTLLGGDASPESRRFLEEQVSAAQEPELRQAAATALVRWDAPDAAAQLWSLYGRLGPGSARGALLEKAYRADTGPVQDFLLSIVSGETDPDVRRSVLGAVALSDPQKQAPVKRAILQKGLSDADAGVRQAALDALRRLKVRELINVARRLQDSDPSEEVRRAAAKAVATLNAP